MEGLSTEEDWAPKFSRPGIRVFSKHGRSQPHLKEPFVLQRKQKEEEPVKIQEEQITIEEPSTGASPNTLAWARQTRQYYEELDTYELPIEISPFAMNGLMEEASVVDISQSTMSQVEDIQPFDDYEVEVIAPPEEQLVEAAPLEVAEVVEEHEEEKKVSSVTKVKKSRKNKKTGSKKSSKSRKGKSKQAEEEEVMVAVVDAVPASIESFVIPVEIEVIESIPAQMTDAFVLPVVAEEFDLIPALHETFIIAASVEEPRHIKQKKLVADDAENKTSNVEKKKKTTTTKRKPLADKNGNVKNIGGAKKSLPKPKGLLDSSAILNESSVMMSVAEFDKLMRAMHDMDSSVALDQSIMMNTSLNQSIVSNTSSSSLQDPRKQSLALGEDEEVGLLAAFLGDNQ